MRKPWLLLFAFCLSGCANACEDPAAPPRAAQDRQRSDLPEPYEGPPPEGKPIATEDLARVIPEELGDFKAEGEAQSRSVPLANRGSLTSARRNYSHGGLTLALEITDTVHAPDVRGLVDRAQAVSHKRDSGTFEGATIKGHRSVVQWHGPGKTALVNMLVEERFLVNLKLSPVDSAAQASALAEQVPLEGLLELKRTNEAANPGAKAKLDQAQGQAQGQAQDQATQAQGATPAATPAATAEAEPSATGPAAEQAK